MSRASNKEMMGEEVLDKGALQEGSLQDPSVWNPSVERASERVPLPVAVMIGAGRVASHLAPEWHRKGIRFKQVYSRTEESASALAQQLGAEAVTCIEELTDEADLFVVSLADDALHQLLPRLLKGREKSLWIHTAGSVPMQIFQGKAERYGVLYPMQTFSKSCEVDFSKVSLFVEASSEAELCHLKRWASLLSPHVYEADSQKRKALHVAAVVTCNFVNHLFTLADEWLTQNGLPFEAMCPLIDETARKVHTLSPQEAQTGPAVRGDRKIVEEHLHLLESNPNLQHLYRLLSESIMQTHGQ